MTIQEIKSIAKETFWGRKQSLIDCKDYRISIVGGKGLYGDFETTFEIAVIRKDDGEFITKNLVEGADQDVIAYASIQETEEIVNKLMFAN
jgi:hypothetical protein